MRFPNFLRSQQWEEHQETTKRISQPRGGRKCQEPNHKNTNDAFRNNADYCTRRSGPERTIRHPRPRRLRLLNRRSRQRAPPPADARHTRPHPCHTRPHPVTPGRTPVTPGRTPVTPGRTLSHPATPPSHPAAPPSHPAAPLSHPAAPPSHPAVPPFEQSRPVTALWRWRQQQADTLRWEPRPGSALRQQRKHTRSP